MLLSKKERQEATKEIRLGGRPKGLSREAKKKRLLSFLLSTSGAEDPDRAKF